MDREIERLYTFDEVLNAYYDYQDIGGDHSVQSFVRMYYTAVYSKDLDFLGYEKNSSSNARIQD